MYQPNVFIHEANVLKDPTLLLLSFLMISRMVEARMESVMCALEL